ncbi:MAG: hypothetical protein WAT23_19525 [Chromatiaceae bacterium]
MTNLKSATTIASTTPPTPLNDAHQGGYFFTVVKTPANADTSPEPHRIVAKVDELMAICDQLETHLSATQTDSRRLLEAVLDEALA